MLRGRGGSMQGLGGMSRGQEAEGACQEDQRQWQRNNRGNTITSWQTRGQGEGRHLQTRGDVNHQEDKKRQWCNKRHRDNQPETPADKSRQRLENRWHLKTMSSGGCATRGQENEVAHCKDDRGRWMQCDKRGRNNQPGQTREVNGRRTPRLAALKLGSLNRHALCTYFVGKYGRLFKDSTL
jgi:hypothetical protein